MARRVYGKDAATDTDFGAAGSWSGDALPVLNDEAGVDARTIAEPTTGFGALSGVALSKFFNEASLKVLGRLDDEVVVQADEIRWDGRADGFVKVQTNNAGKMIVESTGNGLLTIDSIGQLAGTDIDELEVWSGRAKIEATARVVNLFCGRGATVEVMSANAITGEIMAYDGGHVIVHVADGETLAKIRGNGIVEPRDADGVSASTGAITTIDLGGEKARFRPRGYSGVITTYKQSGGVDESAANGTQMQVANIEQTADVRNIGAVKTVSTAPTTERFIGKELAFTDV